MYFCSKQPLPISSYSPSKVMFLSFDLQTGPIVCHSLPILNCNSSTISKYTHFAIWLVRQLGVILLKLTSAFSFYSWVIKAQRNFYNELITVLRSDPRNLALHLCLHCFEIFPQCLLSSILWKFQINFGLYTNTVLVLGIAWNTSISVITFIVETFF